MTTRYAIDPITRIEGHLRIEVEVNDATDAVEQAWSTGTMFRGIERIMAGRDPLETWMFAQRACGVCTHVHAIASIRAVENALGVRVPDNARVLRNIMCATQTVHDHVVHFYHLHALDWVDVTATLSADPAATAKLAESLSPGRPQNSEATFATVKSRLAALVDSGRLGPFQHGYWGHPAYAPMEPDASLLLMAHYLEALDFQREIVKIHAYIGGKNPHPQTYAVGGMSTTFGPSVRTGVNRTSLTRMRAVADQARAFVSQVLVPDVALLVERYGPRAGGPWADLGQGLGNLLAYGDLPLADGTLAWPSGRIVGQDLTGVRPVDLARVGETVASSWYGYSAGDGALLHPLWGETRPTYTGPLPPYDMIDPGPRDKYSWLKAPRYEGQAYEVGPLARLMVAYAGGQAATVASVDAFLARTGLTLTQMFSTLGRLAARALETDLLVGRIDTWLAELQAAQARGDLTVAVAVPPRSRWRDVDGWGTTEAPRGALGHWIRIRNGVVENYQMVVPSTWNGSPRDASGQMGAWESALRGTPMSDPARPVELLRTVHSFDPCMGCAVHVLRPGQQEPLSVAVVA